MSKLIELVGRRFGFMVVLEQASHRRGQALWRCRCICGRVIIVGSQNLRRGTSKSCGCKSGAMRRMVFDRRRPEARPPDGQTARRWLTRQQAIQRVFAGGGACSISSATSTLRDWRVAGKVRTRSTGRRYWAFGDHRQDLEFNRADLDLRLRELVSR